VGRECRQEHRQGQGQRQGHRQGHVVRKRRWKAGIPLASWTKESESEGGEGLVSRK